MVVDATHDPLAAAECANRHTTTNRLRQADEVGIDRIEFGDTTRGNGHASFDLVEDQQYAMLARNITHILEIALFRQHDANVHQYRFGDDGCYLTFVLGQDTIQSPGIVIWSHNSIVLQPGGNTFRSRNGIWMIRRTSIFD